MFVSSVSMCRTGESSQYVDKKPSATANHSCYKVDLLENVTLPPLSETVVPAKVEATELSRWGILEHTKRLPVLMVGRTLVDLEREQLPLRLVNLSDEPRKLKKGTELAGCEPVECVVNASVQDGEGIVRGVEVLNRLPSMSCTTKVSMT